MKQKFLAVSVVLVAPLMSFAQSNAPVTREGVRAELIQLEEAGYNPGSDHTQYPRNIEAAEARLHAQDRAGAPDLACRSARSDSCAIGWNDRPSNCSAICTACRM